MDEMSRRMTKEPNSSAYMRQGTGIMSPIQGEQNAPPRRVKTKMAGVSKGRGNSMLGSFGGGSS